MLIVRVAENPKWRLASCWSVEVMKGGVGFLFFSFSVDGFNFEGSAFEAAGDVGGCFFIGDEVEVLAFNFFFFDFFAIDGVEEGGERFFCFFGLKLSEDVPVFNGNKGFDLFFSVDDELEGNRLDAAGGEAAIAAP